MVVLLNESHLLDRKSWHWRINPRRRTERGCRVALRQFGSSGRPATRTTGTCGIHRTVPKHRGTPFQVVRGEQLKEVERHCFLCRSLPRRDGRTTPTAPRNKAAPGLVERQVGGAPAESE